MTLCDVAVAFQEPPEHWTHARRCASWLHKDQATLHLQEILELVRRCHLLAEALARQTTKQHSFLSSHCPSTVAHEEYRLALEAVLRKSWLEMHHWQRGCFGRLTTHLHLSISSAAMSSLPSAPSPQWPPPCCQHHRQQARSWKLPAGIRHVGPACPRVVWISWTALQSLQGH